MKKNETFLSVSIAAILCLALTVLFWVGSDPTDKVITVTMPYAQSAGASAQAPAEAPTQAPAETPTQAPPVSDANGTATEAPDANQGATEAPSQNSGLPSTPADILNKYTQVMDKAKAEGPAHSKVEYQAIPKEKVNFGGGIFDRILPIASNFFTTEEDARANPEIREKGNDMYWFPPYRVTKGCMLTDVSKIKSATCTELPDGNVKITIVLNDEINPEPPAEGATSCDNAVGAMFNPIQRAEVDNTLQNDPAVKFIIRDVDFKLTYYDCTADLVYNPANDQIVSLDQYMHILIDITSGKVLGLSAVGTAVLDNYMYLSDFAY